MASYIYDNGAVDHKKMRNMLFQFIGKLPNAYPTSQLIETVQFACDAWNREATTNKETPCQDK